VEAVDHIDRLLKKKSSYLIFIVKQKRVLGTKRGKKAVEKGAEPRRRGRHIFTPQGERD